MAILSAFNWQEFEIVGITTLFGNVPVHLATENALVLRDLMAQHDASGARFQACLVSAPCDMAWL